MCWFMGRFMCFPVLSLVWQETCGIINRFYPLWKMKGLWKSYGNMPFRFKRFACSSGNSCAQEEKGRNSETLKCLLWDMNIHIKCHHSPYKKNPLLSSANNSKTDNIMFKSLKVNLSRIWSRNNLLLHFSGGARQCWANQRCLVWTWYSRNTG